MLKTYKAYKLEQAVKDRPTVLVGTYSTLVQLKRSWERHFWSHAPLVAWHVVGGREINVDDLMPVMTRELTEFRSAEERDNNIIANAVYFTVVRFLGVGKYERHKVALKEEALTLAAKLSHQAKGNYLIYAINANGRYQSRELRNCMTSAYADIHHFDAKSKALDEDGDPMLGWYFQIMQKADKAISALTGPYGHKDECETAALAEWGTIPA